MVNNAIEKAQRKVEGHNFDIRKNLLEFDDVSNDQRQVIYQQRRDLMGGGRHLRNHRRHARGRGRRPHQRLRPPGKPGGAVGPGGFGAGPADRVRQRPASAQVVGRGRRPGRGGALRKRILEQVEAECAAKEQQWAAQGVDMRMVEKQIMLQILDQRWKEHLASMDYLRQSIHLRAYAQKQPKQEYKRESLRTVPRVAVQHQARRHSVALPSADRGPQRRAGGRAPPPRGRRPGHALLPCGVFRLGEARTAAPTAKPTKPPPRAAPFVRTERKVGRNEPCPCGSGKKYKQCHGRAA